MPSGDAAVRGRCARLDAGTGWGMSCPAGLRSGLTGIDDIPGSGGSLRRRSGGSSGKGGGSVTGAELRRFRRTSGRRIRRGLALRRRRSKNSAPRDLPVASRRDVSPQKSSRHPKFAPTVTPLTCSAPRAQLRTETPQSGGIQPQSGAFPSPLIPPAALQAQRQPGSKTGTRYQLLSQPLLINPPFWDSLNHR